MVDVYDCDLCEGGVEFNTDDMQEHNEFNLCLSCFEKEADTNI